MEMTNPISFENPIDYSYFKLVAYGHIAIIGFGVILALLYFSIIPIIMATGVIVLASITVWIRHVFYKPIRIIVDKRCITMVFRYRSQECVRWSELKGIWISDNPRSVAEAIIAPINKKAFPVTREIALKVTQAYIEAVGAPPPKF